MASEMDWWREVLVCKPDDPSLIPGPHKIAGKNQLLRVVLWPSIGTVAHTCLMHRCTHTNK